ncbi:hypothetical protein LOK49_LG04G00137 [Camellia lanceoleosa]|uniref:Uncharacterized protein n=1 Tax=Camellia lanceoleosa TaxID=1840588 RepID=A0ACC0I183_9ERIC|nr:hypothetical protein LOK49_LG04G00137 [Camellia lanceoleosa]
MFGSRKCSKEANVGRVQLDKRLHVIYFDEDQKFDKDITVGLICSELLNLAEYNVYMAKLLDGARNKAATEFAISLIQTLLINDSKVISKLHNFVDALAKAPRLSVASKEDYNIVESMEPDPAGFRVQVIYDLLLFSMLFIILNQ